ncbi:hypothetical protein T440DRAFT_407932 [Plenodomus tracheiphilus IPT5]|uniref:DUF7704 domain-containing protein n=1 Tax=Plenodomus tracheiphilus IPT5 TaxID=1408161 RepID=A0A6A7AT80_9PLEO|nr:hypothetical protein T440DRAFT_407932 [Plenodomus tracheiphilus IPT5]
MASALPTIPRYVFGIFEPAILIVAVFITSIWSKYYVSSQSDVPITRPLSQSEEIHLYQLSNLFLLIAVTSIYVLNATDDIKVARAFLTALWWGDVGHLSVTAWCMRRESLSKLHKWNLVNWGNIAIPTFLFTARTIYLLDLFGGNENAKSQKQY